MTDILQVYWGKSIVGQLRMDDKGDFSFQYAPEWIENPSAIPLSIRLPLRKEPYPDSICRFFFSNLLPEGNVRALIARKLGISETNDFELLIALGGDCAGAISLLPEGQKVSDQGEYERVTPKELDAMIEGMSSRPLLVWKEELRLSLAGAQQKLPVYVEGEKIYLPRGTYPSSHILKPKITGFDQIIENEAFCMTLAKRYGLPVPEARILTGGGKAALSCFRKWNQPIYLVERYDRKRDVQNRLIRLHQEDFCQALGYSYTRKYEGEGGPNLQNCLSLLSDRGTEPLIDKKIFIQWIVFNYLIGNCDAHAKNASMLITQKDYRLAPLYDLVSTTLYPSLSAKLAMRIGGENRPEWILRKHWERLSENAGVGTKVTLAICEEMSETLPGLAAQLSKEFTVKYGGQEIVKKICKNISSLSKRALAGF